MSSDYGFGQERWTLPAPESYVLLEGSKADGARTLKLALLELVARKYLILHTVEEPRRFGRTKSTAVLSPGSADASTATGALRSVLERYGRAETKTYPDGTVGVPVAELARAMGTGGGLSTWVRDVVLPELELRGLYAREQRKRLGLFTTTQWTPTPAGEQLRQELLSRTQQGEREFRGWVDTDPARALAFVGIAGSSVFLLDQLHPDIRRLREQQGGDTGYYGASDASSDPDEMETEPDADASDAGALEAGGLDMGGLDADAFSLDFDLGAFDGLDGAFDAIDAGVDSGTDAGGGDGGGGDGGGGGGG